MGHNDQKIVENPALDAWASWAGKPVLKF